MSSDATGILFATVFTLGWLLFREKSKKNIAIIQRKVLTNPPSYDIIIGNLPSVQKAIENFLLSTKSGLKIKENLPFICIVNPPRYGKSLLLDSLFLNSNITVISITYNSTSPFSTPELTSVETCLQYFWTRVLMSVLDSNLTLSKMFEMYGSKCNSFDDVVNLSENWQLATADVVICVDEFSSVTDCARTLWPISEQKRFTNKLQEWKSLTPLRQFVMSGFNKDMTNLLCSGSTVKSFSLQHCTFRAAKPLLAKIYQEYVRHEKSEQFPVLIFECIKSSPGLVGQWAEFVHAGIFIADLEGFVNNVNWLILLSDSKYEKETNDAPLDRNWDLILKFLIFDEFSIRIPDDLESQLISSNLAVNLTSSSGIELSPFPLLAISASYSRNRRGHKSSLQRTINLHIENIFKIITGYDIQYKDGKFFEAYVEGALRVRLLLRQLLQTTLLIDDDEYIPFPANDDYIPISAAHFLPTKRVYEWSLNCVKFSLLIISDKEDLKKFLINPLYYMFPVGVAALTEEVEVACSNSGIEEKRKSKRY
jgi:hypothetical protein